MKLPNHSVRTALLFAIACWIWGSTWLAIKFGLQGVPPFVGAAIRMAISGILLTAFAAITRVSWPRTRTYIVHVLTTGVLLFGLQFALVYWSELTVPSGLVAVLFAMNPLLTSLLASAVFRIETLAPVNYLGLVAGLFGVGLIFWSEVINASHAPPVGALAALAASVTASVSTVLAKRVHDIPPIATVGPGQIVGAIVLGTLALLTERSEAVHFTTASTIALIYLTVFGSAIAFLTYFTLLRTMSVTKLSLLTYITPIIAVLLGYLVAHERFALTTIAGVPIVFAGIGLVHLKPRAASSVQSNTLGNKATGFKAAAVDHEGRPLH